MCFPVRWSILGTINVRQVSACLLQGRFSMAEFNERRRFMGRFRRIIFTLTVTLFLAAGVTIVTGLGSMSEKQNDTEQGQKNLGVPLRGEPFKTGNQKNIQHHGRYKTYVDCCGKCGRISG